MPITDINRKYVQQRQQELLSADKNKQHDVFQELGIGEKKVESGKKNTASEMGDFMRLFLAQLKNQDPLDPKDGADFVAQLAQFNTVEGIQRLNTSFDQITQTIKASKILEASSLIGKKIQVPSNKMYLESDSQGIGKPINTVLQIPDINKDIRPGEQPNYISDMRILISNAKTGEIVDKITKGQQYPDAKVKFVWQGMDGNGQRLQNQAGQPIEDGEYRITSEILVGNEWQRIDTIISAEVNNVMVDKNNNEITLNAGVVGNIGLNELTNISQ